MVLLLYTSVMKNKTVFYHLLTNTLFASVINAFVWFAVTFWVFLETQSVLATSYIAGIFAVANMLSAYIFGTIVDKKRKKTAMMYSSVLSLFFYLIAGIIFFSTPIEVFSDPGSVVLWLLILVLMLGSVSGNLRMIALSTTVTILFSEGRDKANGLIGAMNGISFSITSVLSGLVIGFSGMHSVIFLAVLVTVMALIHLTFIPLVEPKIAHINEEDKVGNFSFKKTLAIVLGVPGLIGLIFFTTFNNFLGGVFMALMDAYGLSLVSVEVWGIMFAVVSVGFILGSAVIAKYGLGQKPLKTMLMVNVIAWTTCMFFTIQPSVLLLFVGMLIWMTVSPFAEAAEQTVIQTVVPLEKQGRVFGFAQSIESAAMPMTTFIIGPIATFIFIPFMTTGAGVGLIGDWFGVGQDRGIALLFTVAGVVGLLVTLLAFQSKAYRQISTVLIKKRDVSQKTA